MQQNFFYPDLDPMMHRRIGLFQIGILITTLVLASLTWGVGMIAAHAQTPSMTDIRELDKQSAINSERLNSLEKSLHRADDESEKSELRGQIANEKINNLTGDVNELKNEFSGMLWAIRTIAAAAVGIVLKLLTDEWKKLCQRRLITPAK